MKHIYMRIILAVCDTNIIGVKEPCDASALKLRWIIPDGGERVLTRERGWQPVFA